MSGVGARGGQSPHVDRGHIPRDSPGDPLTQMARCTKARMRARPAARLAQNGTRRPPERRRAAETVNVSCFGRRGSSWKARDSTVGIGERYCFPGRGATLGGSCSAGDEGSWLRLSLGAVRASRDELGGLCGGLTVCTAVAVSKASGDPRAELRVDVRPVGNHA
jgi:hypothetical protein